MKHIINSKYLFFCLMFFSFIQNLMAQNNLRLLSANGKPIKVFVDEKIFNNTPQAEVLIENILKDTVNIKVEFDDKLVLRGFVFLLNQGIRDTNLEYYYLVSQNEKRLKLDFKGVTEVIKLPNPIVPLKPALQNENSINNKLFGHLYELVNNKASFFNNLQGEKKCITPLPVEYLNYMDALFKKTGNLNARLDLAIEVCKNNCMSVAQLNSILNYLESEFDKMSVAKIGFYNLVDTVNKSDLLKSFKLEASSKEMNYFILNSNKQKLRYSKYCNRISEDDEISELYKKQLEAENDSYRLDFLKKVYINYCFSVNQIIRILEVYTHDREKLDAAKLMYFKCAEQNQYQLIKSIFSYKLSNAELEDFLSKQLKQ